MSNIAVIDEKKSQERFSGGRATFKEGKYKEVDKLIQMRKQNKIVVKELSGSKNLSEKDATKLCRAKENVERLTKTIDEQIKDFNLTYKKIQGDYVYTHGVKNK